MDEQGRFFMEKKSRYNKEYLSNIVFVLIVAATVGICAFISQETGLMAYADGPALTSSGPDTSSSSTTTSSSSGSSTTSSSTTSSSTTSSSTTSSSTTSSSSSSKSSSSSIPAKPSDYSKLAKGGYDEDDDHDSLGITAELSKKKVGSILDYAYEKDSSIRDRVNLMMKNDEVLSLTLSIQKLSSSDVDDDEKDKMKKKARSYDDADDAKLANYFDISLYLSNDNDFFTNYPIKNSGESISFTYKIPDSVKKTSSSSSKHTRYYNVVRYHDGGAHGVGNDYTSDTSMDFKVSEFSTFATAYYDKSSSSSSSSSSSKSSGGGSSSTLRISSAPGAGAPGIGAAGTGAAAGGGSTGSRAPKTGDEFNAKLWIYFLVIGIVVALCSFILFQDTKEYYDDKKEESKS